MPQQTLKCGLENINMTTIQYPCHFAAALIKQKIPNFQPLIGIVLGSGLGMFAEELENATVFDYKSLPGFPEASIYGHSGKLVAGYLLGVAVVCLQGRAHSYEGDNHAAIKTYVRTLKLLGCDYFLATNASGSLRPEMGPGSLMLIQDHINLQPGNPLIGPNDDEFGPRFFPLDNVYNLNLRNGLLHIAAKEQIFLYQGTYISVLGPNYETAAEIKAFRILGADAVGMSTVPEILVAVHCGMKVAAIAVITNFATGIADTSHSHEAVVLMASKAAKQLNHLLKQFISQLNNRKC